MPGRGSQQYGHIAGHIAKHLPSTRFRYTPCLATTCLTPWAVLVRGHTGEHAARRHNRAMGKGTHYATPV